jgi:hypothetical protein
VVTPGGLAIQSSEIALINPPVPGLRVVASLELPGQDPVERLAIAQAKPHRRDGKGHSFSHSTFLSKGVAD